MRRKKFIIVTIVIFLIFIIFTSMSASAEDWAMNGYEFDYSNPSFDTAALQIIIDITMPEGFPTYYEPYWWDSEYKEMREEGFIRPPNTDTLLTGVYSNSSSSYKFTFESNYPIEGEYLFSVIASHPSELRFNQTFDLYYGYLGNVTSGKWIYNYDNNAYSLKNPMDEKDIGAIDGFQVNIDLENTGVIPYFVDSPRMEKLPFLYKIFLIKDNSIVYSTDLEEIDRPNDIFSGQETPDKFFIKPGESITITQDILGQSSDFANLAKGTYSVSGYIQYEDTIYDFFSPNILTIKGPETTPGYEFIFVLLAIITLFIVRKKMNKLDP